MYKNKFNIPVLNNKPLRKGNFIDHYSITHIGGKYIFKRRNISNIDELKIFGIHLTIHFESKNP